jgi:hypothetical protein
MWIKFLYKQITESKEHIGFIFRKSITIFAAPETRTITARVAKLVDALCSGRSVRKDVLVRIQSRARDKLAEHL